MYRQSSITLIAALLLLANNALAGERTSNFSKFSIDNSKTDVGSFNDFYQANTGGPALFSTELLVNRVTANFEFKRQLEDSTSLAFDVSYWKSTGAAGSSVWIANGVTNTASLDGVYQTANRFSNADVDTQLNYSDRGIRLAAGTADLPLGSNGKLRFTGFAESGDQFWHLNKTHTYNDHGVSALNGLQATANIDEHLWTGKLGVSAAAEHTTPLTAAIGFVAKGRIDIYGQYAKLDGAECTPQTFGQCDGGHWLGGSPYYSKARDSNFVLAASGRLDAGLDISPNPDINFYLGTFAGLNLHAAQVANPVFTSPAAAHITYFNGFEYGGKFSLTIGF